MNSRLTPLQREASPLQIDTVEFFYCGDLICGDFALCGMHYFSCIPPILLLLTENFGTEAIHCKCWANFIFNCPAVHSYFSVCSMFSIWKSHVNLAI